MSYDLGIVKQYLYRIHTAGGHVHQAYVPYATVPDLWDMIKQLVKEGDCLHCYAMNHLTGHLFEVGFLASCITVIDAAMGKDTIVLDDHAKGLKLMRTKNAVKQAKANKEKLKAAAASGGTRKHAKKRTL